MSANLRLFSQSLQNPNAQTADDPNAQASADGGAAVAPPAVDASPAPGDPAPVQLVDYVPPQPEPPYADPLVGKGKLVDPKDMVVTTPPLPLDLDALRKLIKDPLGRANPVSKPGENFPDAPPGEMPPGPGYTWDKYTRGWTRVKDPNSGICPVIIQPWAELAPLCVKYLSDHHFKAVKGEEIVPGDMVCDMYLDDSLVELRATTGQGQAQVGKALLAAFPDLKNYPIDLAHLIATRWDAAVHQALASK